MKIVKCSGLKGCNSSAQCNALGNGCPKIVKALNLNIENWSLIIEHSLLLSGLNLERDVVMRYSMPNKFRTPDPWKLLLLQFIGIGVGIGIGIEYYSHASIPIPIPTATPIEANPTYAFSTEL